jgi:hypothetical protein
MAGPVTDGARAFPPRDWCRTAAGNRCILPALDLYVGTIQRDSWQLQPVTATIRENTLFEAAGLPTPTADPVCQYSPGFEMAVEPVAIRRPEGKSSGTPSQVERQSGSRLLRVRSHSGRPLTGEVDYCRPGATLSIR